MLMVSSLSYGQGSRYTGTYKKSNPITHSNKSDIIIEGIEISGIEGRAISLFNSQNIIIRNCKFKDIATSAAIYAENSANILITDCTFENVHRGFIAGNGKGNIKFEHNDVKNILGTLQGGVAFSQAVQFQYCNGPGNSISFNSIENISGQSSPEDIINIYMSNGTAASPIMVNNNWLRGGGPSPSGGGILLGDWGGSYQKAENNILVNPGQYGMGIGGGTHMTLKNNKIYAKRQSFTNVGLSICNWTESNTGKSHSITIENNDINWTNKEGNLNLWWIYQNMEPVKGKETNKYNEDLNESILPENILNRAKSSDDNPTVTPPDNNNPDSPITQVYIDSYKRIAIKYLVPSIPVAHAEGFTSNGQLLIAMTLPRYNQAFPISVPKGDYYVKITYPELEKTEITKVTIN